MTKTCSFSVIVILLAVLVSCEASLKCYECSDCKNSIGTSVKCDDDYDSCIKYSVINGVVHKACTRKSMCEMGSKAIEKGKDALESIKSFFTGNDKDMNTAKNIAKANQINCCSSDNCNSAISKLGSPLLLLLLPILLQALRNH